MTTFRFKAGVMLALFASACAKNMPPSDTDLGRIARISDIKETERALGAYAENRLADRAGLRASLIGAGFARTADPKCEIFRWSGKPSESKFDKAMVLSICDGRVEANAGYRAL